MLYENRKNVICECQMQTRMSKKIKMLLNDFNWQSTIHCHVCCYLKNNIYVKRKCSL